MSSGPSEPRTPASSPGRPAGSRRAPRASGGPYGNGTLSPGRRRPPGHPPTPPPGRALAPSSLPPGPNRGGPYGNGKGYSTRSGPALDGPLPPGPNGSGPYGNDLPYSTVSGPASPPPAPEEPEPEEEEDTDEGFCDGGLGGALCDTKDAVGDAAGDGAHFVGDVGKGVGKGGEEVFDAVTHPGDTISGLAHSVTHPKDTFNAILGSCDDLSTGECLGYGLSSVVGTKGLGKAASVSGKAGKGNKGGKPDSSDADDGGGDTPNGSPSGSTNGGSPDGGPRPVPKPQSRGWSAGDKPDIYSPTRTGQDPSWGTVRRRYWRNRATEPDAAQRYGGAQNVDRMKRGLAPQRYNPDKGSRESLELSHEPVPKRSGGRDIRERWPCDHASVDPNRHPGYCK